MKNIKLVFFLLIISIITFCVYSCKREITEDDFDKIRKYTSEIDSIDNKGAISDNYSEIGSSWFVPETKYNNNADDTSDSIVSLFKDSLILTPERIYYPVKIYYNDSTNYEPSYAYVSKNTGNCTAICPDPLCTHLDGSECRYLNIRQMLYSAEEDCLYATKYIYDGPDISVAICRIDTHNDIIEEICIEKTTMLSLKFISNGRLYYDTIIYEKIKNSDNTITKAITEKFKTIDLSTRSINILDNKYADHEYGEFYYTDNTYIYFIDASQSRLFVTDMNFENEQTVLEYGSDYQISNMYYDYKTMDLFVSIRSKYMGGVSDVTLINGYICRIDGALNIEKIEFPEKNIMNISLTEKYIYYTVYDPIEYGSSPRGGKCIEYTGNKIYRTNRDGYNNHEVVFDGRDELFFTSYLPVGNYIYLNYKKFMNEGGMNWFRDVGMSVRVDMENNTIKWLELQ